MKHQFKLPVIKFRGFHKGQVVYFDFEKIIGNRHGVPCVILNKPDDVVMGGEYVSIHLLENVTQFSGLTSEDEKEIYDGDIVFSEGHKALIVFENGEFCANFNCFNKKYDTVGIYGNIEIDEIIGNIFQNPELMK